MFAGVQRATEMIISFVTMLLNVALIDNLLAQHFVTIIILIFFPVWL